MLSESILKPGGSSHRYRMKLGDVGNWENSNMSCLAVEPELTRDAALAIHGASLNSCPMSPVLLGSFPGNSVDFLKFFQSMYFMFQVEE